MKRFIRVTLLLCAIIALQSVLLLNTAGAKATTSSGEVLRSQSSFTSCGKWGVVPAPQPGSSSGLSAVAAISSNAIWAVGSSGSRITGNQTLIEYWDGVSWQIVTSPNPSLMYNTLYGVAAVSTADAWAVGYYANTTGGTQTLIERWNGSNWNVVTSPSPGTVNNELFSVAAVSANDVWAVGFTSNGTVDQTLIEHWNGSRWSVVTSPSSGSSNDHLSSVAVVSASDVWAVGNSNTFSGTLIEHWNGSHWSIVTSPSPGSSDDLRGVAAVSASDVWAAGYTLSGSSIEALVEHWDGTSWQVTKSPGIGSGPSFSAIAAASATDVWAVGSDSNGNTFFQTLIEHWNGLGWSVMPGSSPGSFSTQLLGVTAVSATDVWAVGYADSNVLIEHYQC